MVLLEFPETDLAFGADQFDGFPQATLSFLNVCLQLDRRCHDCLPDGQLLFQLHCAGFCLHNLLMQLVDFCTQGRKIVRLAM
ncbi:MAG: hypothetical protein R3B91_01770 [Planctomycetaceae bacterium]